MILLFSGFKKKFPSSYADDPKPFRQNNIIRIVRRTKQQNIHGNLGDCTSSKATEKM